MNARQRRPNSDGKCAVESRSLDTGTKRLIYKEKLVTLDVLPLIIPRTPRNPIAKVMIGNDIDDEIYVKDRLRWHKNLTNSQFRRQTHET